MGGMKVGVIAAEMEGRATGVGRYLEGLLDGLGRWDHGIEWHLFFQGEPPPGLGGDDGEYRVHTSEHNGSRVFWEQILVSRELAALDLDVVFGPAYTLPFGLRSPAVVTMHDLSFEILPEEFGPRERWRRRFLARRAARVAQRVLTDTRYVADLVADRYRLPSERLAVVPLGVDGRRFSPQGEDGDRRVLEALGVRSPYLLWVGTVLERRMPREVLKAFAALRRDRSNLQLVIAGVDRMRRGDSLEIWVRELGLETAVRLLGWVEESSLAPLYRAAELGIYVSGHEGFGIPPLECLSCGTPVVVSTGLGLDDAWPDYPYRVNGLGGDAIAAIAREILTDEERAADVAARACEVVANLSWEASSRLLVAELERAVPR
jgi:glycosyltransferase involved in cell wall biosynthesis